MRVKNLFIQIPDYDFSGKSKDDHYIGRNEVRGKLKRRLIPSHNKKCSYQGAYLVAGYRGMGKTTMVQSVLNDIAGDEIKPELLKVEVFLSQGNLSDYDLLRQMFVQLETKLEEKLKLRFLTRNLIFKASIISFLLMLFFSWLVHKSIMSWNLIDNGTVVFLNNLAENEALTVGIYLFLYFLIFLALKYRLSKRKKHLRKLFKMLFDIKRRVHSDLELSYGGSDSEMALAKVTDALKSPFSFVTGKQSTGSTKQMFQKYTTKELEFELKEVLDYLHRQFCSDFKIIFIVDELDKLEPEYGVDNNGYKNVIASSVYTRREIVNTLLANLKSFINTADAKFIFIGGAEMYEASLADIADRESFYSSIFDEVFYVNTFFKDGSVGVRNNITQMVDTYLLNLILFGKEETNDSSNYPNYSHFYQRLGGIDDNEKSWILYQVNRYLIYLTYRSNGSPKKLKMLIEDNIIEVGSNDHHKNIGPDSIILNYEITKEKSYKILSGSYNFNTPASNGEYDRRVIPGYYLQIKFDLQYKSNLHTSIFLPFLIKNEHHLREFNDKNLYLSAFLMDHILKFHKSAFSWRELEMMPDIIMGSKGPSLRDTLNEIINYLSIKHIRETTNAMFQFKFRSRVALELQYASKLSNESAAAFNFTYDESQHLQSFFKQKLKSKIESYKENKSVVGDSFIHSLTYLNSLLAEIHFYDENYGSAIQYYSDAIQALRNLDTIGNNHQKILFTRYRLLLSLCLEKSKNYDSTYSVLRSTLIDIGKIEFKQEGNSIFNKKWEQPYKRMQLFLRPHLSLLMAIEKKRSDGVTVGNLKRNIKEYCDFMGLKDLFPYSNFNSDYDFRNMVKNNKESDYKRIQTLLADYFQSVGAILFYKNRNFLKLYENGAVGILFNHLGIKSIDDTENSEEGDSYLTLNGVRKIYEVDHPHYFPSFSAFFYYSTSLGHLLLPFIENMQAIYGTSILKENIAEIKLSEKLFMLEHLAFDPKALHILGGKQKELIALILSKLSDSILSCIGSKKEAGFRLKKKNPNFRLFFDKAYRLGKNWDYCKISSFNELFDISTVLYLNILSSKFYHLADKHYDSYFALKKCLYVLISHKSLWEETEGDTVRFDFLEELSEWLLRHCREIINTYSITPRISEEFFFKNVTGGEFISNSMLNSDDENELKILEDRCSLIRDNSMENIERLLNERSNRAIHTIGSIFSRTQQLKFQTELIYARHNEYIEGLFNLGAISSISLENEMGQVPTSSILFTDDNTRIVRVPSINFFRYSKELIFCYKNLITIINTYGIRYTMSNSYIASIYKNLINWSRLLQNIGQWVDNHGTERYNNEDLGLLSDLKDLLNKRTHLFNADKNWGKAVEHYENAVSMHSEGAEYKRVIQDMYILEDDFNDGLIHFYAALERSLLNSGIINNRLNALKNGNLI
tara:strand:+ start:15249 stop:19514 length:4266 start_codon:yes stop_codon:yes gene_type:complete